MERILITGGCGFVGSNLIESLRRRPGLTIRVLDNESTASRRDIDAFEVEFLAGDIRDRATVERAMAGIDAVVHLAADTRVIDSIEDPGHNFDANVVGSFNLLMAARAAGVRSFIAASTGGAIMGRTPPPYHEGKVPRPISPYGASKLALEAYLSAFSGAYGMHCLALRFSNVFGPRSYHKGSVVATFFRQILQGEALTIYGDGSQVRDYVHVRDIVQAIELALDRRPAIDAIQLGSGQPTSLNALIEAIRKTVAPERLELRYADFRTGEVRDTTCLVDLAREHLGYRPQVSLEEGLAETWHWFKTQYAG
jgi:UDP-glucose 4-epimerase